MYRQLATTAIALFGFSSGLALVTASAADLGNPAPAPVYAKAPPIIEPFSWTGFYLGGDVGGAWAKSDGTLTNADGFFPVPYSLNPSGVIGGGFLGFNYQINQLVLGVEGDWQADDLSSTSGPLAPDIGPYSISTKLDSYGSARARLGYAVDHWLFFGTGGAAFGSWSTSYALTGSAPFVTNSTGIRAGWTAGGGVEYAFTRNWLGRVEYRHTDLGTTSFVAGSDTVPPNAAETGNKVTVDDVRAGVAYKFW
jgi:outer membrane immunogenic protein